MNDYTINDRNAVVNVPLHNDLIMTIDLVDLDLIQVHHWTAYTAYGKTRVLRQEHGSNIYISHVIADRMDINPDKQYIYHIDGNTLNNRRSNLSITQSQNRRIPSNNTSGVKGVSWNKEKHKWVASICKNGVSTSKRFNSFESACEWRQNQEKS